MATLGDLDYTLKRGCTQDCQEFCENEKFFCFGKPKLILA